MPKSLTTVSLAEIRRRVVEAQGFASRPRAGTPAEVLATIRRVGCIQLDSVSTVERSHRLALGARVGAYPEPCISRLLRSGKLFEYWAHEACLLPVEDYPMHRWRMAMFAESHPWRGNVFEREPELTRLVLREIGERGPLGSRHFEGTGSGGMWNWKPAKVVLEALVPLFRLATGRFPVTPVARFTCDHAGAADTVPLPVCWRYFTVVVVLPASFDSVFVAEEYRTSPSV